MSGLLWGLFEAGWGVVGGEGICSVSRRIQSLLGDLRDAGELGVALPSRGVDGAVEASEELILSAGCLLPPKMSPGKQLLSPASNLPLR